MKASLPQPPKHTSYLTHRRQVVWQIVLPVVVSALLLIGLIVLISMSAMQGQTDLARLTAVAMIWLTLPVMVFGLIFFFALLVIAYLIGRGMELIPNYTGQAQDFAYRVEGAVKRFTRAAIRPVALLDDLTAKIKGYLGRS